MLGACKSHPSEVSGIMIKKDRLILRLMNENDIDYLLKIFTYKNLMNTYNLHSFSQEQMKKWIDRNLNHQRKHGSELFQ